jgi:hypothetical protein
LSTAIKSLATQKIFNIHGEEFLALPIEVDSFFEAAGVVEGARTASLNELVRIEEMLKGSAKMAALTI